MDNPIYQPGGEDIPQPKTTLRERLFRFTGGLTQGQLALLARALGIVCIIVALVYAFILYSRHAG